MGTGGVTASPPVSQTQYPLSKTRNKPPGAASAGAAASTKPAGNKATLQRRANERTERIITMLRYHTPVT
jgi:hypothetical protein